VCDTVCDAVESHPTARRQGAPGSADHVPASDPQAVRARVVPTRPVSVSALAGHRNGGTVWCVAGLRSGRYLEESVEPTAKRHIRRLARWGTAGAVVVAAAVGCSGAWSHPEPEAPPEPARSTLAVGPGSGAETPAGSGHDPGDTALPQPGGPVPPMGPGTVSPVLSAELHPLRRAAQEHVLDRTLPRSERLPATSTPAEDAEGPDAEQGADETAALSLEALFGYAEGGPALGRFVPLENEAALEPFHAALARLAAGEAPDGKVRILAYGASHTQADAYTGYLRAYLQGRFGDGGQGFVLLGRVNGWYRTLDTRVRHRHLKVRHAHYRAEVENEPLGLLGAALLGRERRAYGEITTSSSSRNTRFEVHYYREPAGGDFSLQIEGRTIARVPTRATDPGPGYFAFETSPGAHEIRAQLRGNGPVRFFGITAETATPGVVVDTLGIGGSRMASQLRWDEAAWADAVRRRNPALVTFAYGTNETTDQVRGTDLYEAQVREVLERLRRAAPEASCLFIAPFDLPKANRPRLLKIVRAQRRLARELSCGFWDGLAFMGGAGAMRRWVTAKPPLASADYIHLTSRGYVYAGTAIGDALMRAYDAERPQSLGAASVLVPLSPGP
jgi:lysophospholipase L1-like esterase